MDRRDIPVRTSECGHDGNGHRLQAIVAKVRHGKRAGALRQAFPIRSCQQVVVAEQGQFVSTKRLHEGNLRSGIGDMVSAPQNVGHTHIEVVHYTWQRVEIRAVFPHQNRVGHGSQIDRLSAPKHVVEDDIGAPRLRRIGVEVRQQKTPVRFAAFRFEGGLLGIGQRQPCSVVDRWFAPRHQPLALAVDLVRRLVACVELTCRAQFCSRIIVQGRAVRLPFRPVGFDTQPGEIVHDPARELVRGTGRIGVVEPQHILPARLGEQPVEHGGADVADVQTPGRRWSEADDRRLGRCLCHGALLARVTPYLNRVPQPDRDALSFPTRTLSRSANALSVATLNSGATRPAEMTSFAASSTLISSTITSLFGTKSR